MALFPWAQRMGETIHDVLTDIDLGLGGMGSQDGETIDARDGKLLIEKFQNEGYAVYEQLKDLWVINSAHSEKYGVTVDFREDMIDEPGNCIIAFYNDDFN